MVDVLFQKSCFFNLLVVHQKWSSSLKTTVRHLLMKEVLTFFLFRINEDPGVFGTQEIKQIL